MKRLQESIKQLGARVESVLDCDLKDRVLRLLSIEDQILVSIELTEGQAARRLPVDHFSGLAFVFVEIGSAPYRVTITRRIGRSSSPQGHEHHRRSSTQFSFAISCCAFA